MIPKTMCISATSVIQRFTSKSKLTNIVLNKGQIYVMYKQYSHSEILQVLFSNGSAKFKHKSVLMMRANRDNSTDVKVDTGQASLLYGPNGLHLEKVELKRSEEVTISVHDQILYAKYKGGVDFSLWNLEMNKNFLALHRGMSDLPKPIQRLSPAVFNFAQKFSNLYGDWLWNDIFSGCPRNPGDGCPTILVFGFGTKKPDGYGFREGPLPRPGHPGIFIWGIFHGDP